MIRTAVSIGAHSGSPHTICAWVGGGGGGVGVWVSGWRVCGSIANGGAFSDVYAEEDLKPSAMGYSCAGERWDRGAHLGDVDDARAILDVFRRDVRLHPLLDRGDRFLRGEVGGVPR